MTEAMSWRAMSAMKGAGGITIGNFVGLSNMAMDMSAIAGYLCSVIPILAWTLLERGGYAFVSMASNLMGVSTGAATQAATEKATGNYSFGNMSFENRNMNNMSQLKHDHAPSYSGNGHMMTNEGSSSMVTDADGHQILTRNESHLPVSLNMAEQQETMLRDTRRDAQSFAEGEQQSATIAKQQANNHYLEIGKQAQHTLSSGTQFQDQETASNMKEAADHYNRVEQISNKTGLSKEYVNQKALEFHAGGNVPLPGAIADIGGKISKSENKQMSASEAAESIMDLSKNTSYQAQHQKMHGFHKNKNVDIQDQELKQSLDNFSSSYETSQRHEQSAHKSFETVKSVDQEIAKTQSSSGSINASYTQDFVDHVGAGNLRHMPVTQQQKEANQYMNQRILDQQTAFRAQSIAFKHEENLKDSYHKSQADQKYGGHTIMQENHKAFSQKVREEQPQLNKAEMGSVMWRVDAKNQTGSEHVMKAEEESKQEQRSATHTFSKEHDNHAEDNMGVFQEGATKDLR